MSRIIVNADDFGIHPLVNEAVVIGHQKGILTSTSLLAGGKSFEDALERRLACPQLGIGIHTALVGSLEPVAPIDKVRSLVTEDGVFYESHVDFIKKLYNEEIKVSEIFTELTAQFEKIMEQNIPITHVDGHQHLHVLPQVLPMVITLMKEYKITKMRIPEESVFFFNHTYDVKRFIGKTGLSVLASRARTVARRSGIATPRYFWGMMRGGHMTEKDLLQILSKVSHRIGTHEIMVHPGLNREALSKEFSWGYQWEGELAALTSQKVRDYMHKKGIDMINFGDLT